MAAPGTKKPRPSGQGFFKTESFSIRGERLLPGDPWGRPVPRR